MNFHKHFFDQKIDVYIKIDFWIKKAGKNLKKTWNKLENSAENANLPRIPIKTEDSY